MTIGGWNDQTPGQRADSVRLHLRHCLGNIECECGGQVRGVEDFGRMWTWCEKCSPVVVIRSAALGESAKEGK